MKIKCLIVDDEKLAADIIEEYVGRIPDLEHIVTCHSAIDALSVLNKNKIDLLFLDIQMPGLTGLQLVRNLTNPPAVIFTTAYTEYALQGFELEVLDYLVKPISFDRFIKAINRYYKQNKELENRQVLLPDIGLSVAPSPPFIFVKSEKVMIKVFLHEITHIESLRNYVTIFLQSKKEVKTLNTLSNIEEKLPGSTFLRVHRSFIVAVNKIDSYNGGSIKIGQKVIPIGRNYKSLVSQILDQNAIE